MMTSMDAPFFVAEIAAGPPLPPSLSDFDRITSHSFGAAEVVQIVIPLAAILAPTVSSVVQSLVAAKSMTIKYEGIELTGNSNQIVETLHDLLKRRSEGSGDELDS